MAQFAALAALGLTLAVAYVAITSWRVRHRALQRLYEQQLDERTAAIDERSLPQRWLGRWLMLAGYRRHDAAAMFVAITAACATLGLLGGVIYRTRFERTLIEMVANVPGSVGELLAVILHGGPWILLALASFVPALFVRAARRRRVRAIEQDLPLALELLATIGEAGLSFDAALSKIIRAQGSDRPLAAEFINFQLDMLAGMSRLQALRQLARRIEITAITTFTSALIQAEQVGAGMAETIRHQADDLRQRRREDALLQAQALPVKLVFPLVICFLPGIFISTIAPVIYQMIEVAGGVLRTGR
jgi:tight adherence protein C